MLRTQSDAATLAFFCPPHPLRQFALLSSKATYTVARPKLILMDEPSMGLSPLLVKEVFSIPKVGTVCGKLHVMRASKRSLDFDPNQMRADIKLRWPAIDSAPAG
jgi:hypothetical protein